MVHRQLSPGRLRAAALGGLALAVVLLAASSASAANRRVAISHYRWSAPQIQLDLGEHVTWYWVGPDTMHSVTGSSANDAGLDSDPGKATPRHQIGDSFELTFNTPGTYDFQCKLHPTVRGTVHVSSVPGDPDTEVDPVPKSHVDLTAPYVDGLSLRSSSFGKRGTSLRYGIDERATVDAEYYRLVPRRHRRHAPPRAQVRRLAAVARLRRPQRRQVRQPRPPLPPGAGPLPRDAPLHRREQQHGAHRVTSASRSGRRAQAGSRARQGAVGPNSLMMVRGRRLCDCDHISNYLVAKWLR